MDVRSGFVPVASPRAKYGTADRHAYSGGTGIGNQSGLRSEHFFPVRCHHIEPDLHVVRVAPVFVIDAVVGDGIVDAVVVGALVLICYIAVVYRQRPRCHIGVLQSQPEMHDAVVGEVGVGAVVLLREGQRCEVVMLLQHHFLSKIVIPSPDRCRSSSYAVIDGCGGSDKLVSGQAPFNSA